MSIPSILKGLKNPLINVQDYQHAAKTFNSNNYALLPKTKRWYHVYFQMHQDAYTQVSNNLKNDTGGQLAFDQGSTALAFLGPLVKSIKLPSFRFEIKKHNQYNKWALNTTKVEYEPVEITLHNDTKGLVETFWYAYYQYMVADPKWTLFNTPRTEGVEYSNYLDSSHGNVSALYNNSDSFANRFGLDTFDKPVDGLTLSEINLQQFYRDQPFFKSIKIFQFNRAIDNSVGPTYDEFTLVNPIITSYGHDQLEYASSDFVTNTMIVDYEICLYAKGQLQPNAGNPDIASWELIRTHLFDNSSSPLGNVAGSTIINTVNKLEFVAQGVVQTVESLPNTVQTITTGIAQNPAGIVNTAINQTISVLGNF